MGPVIVSGLVSGSLYALVASGLSLVWGALGVFNFAHGALLMMGAYVAWTVASSSALGAGIAAGVVASVIFMALAGVVLYLLLVRPWIGKPAAELSVIMTTIAGGIFLENLFLTIYGGRLKVLDQIVVGTIHIAGTAIQYQDLLAILLAPALLGGLALLLTHNKTGLAVRAVAQNPDAARLVGVGVERIYIVTFAVSAVLAGVSGIMLGGLFNLIPSMGSDPLLRAFIVVVFGGLGSLTGTIVGAYVVGMIEAFSSFYIGIYWTPVVLFVVLIVILTVRPTGLMGQRGMRRPSFRVLTLGAVVAAALVAPRIFAGSVAQNLAILSLLYAVVASNWDLTLGYSGIFNFAHVAFFGVAAYVSAIATIKLGVPVWWDLLLAVVAVAALSGLTAILALRQRGIYVALVTFALTQLCIALVNSQKDITGGPVGLVGLPDLAIGGYVFGSHPEAYFYTAEALLILSTLFLRWLVTSDFGLSLIALRDFEDYAVSRGIPAVRQRVLAIVASSVFTSLAGGVYAHYLIVAAPDVFSFSLTTLLLSMVLVGGAASTYGPVIAAVVLTVGAEQLAALGVVRYMIIAVLIVLTLRFLPGGISSLWRSGWPPGWRGGAEKPSLAYADTGTDVEKAP